MRVVIEATQLSLSSGGLAATQANSAWRLRGGFREMNSFWRPTSRLPRRPRPPKI